MSFNFNIIRIERRGFSLLEALIALLILAFSMLGLSFVMLSTIETNRDARRVTAAFNLALDQLEVLRGQRQQWAADRKRCQFGNRGYVHANLDGSRRYPGHQYENRAGGGIQDRQVRQSRGLLQTVITEGRHEGLPRRAVKPTVSNVLSA